jgi:hypothetical protein
MFECYTAPTCCTVCYSLAELGSHSKNIRLLLLFEHYMFRPNWPSSNAQGLEESTAPLSRCYTLHFKVVKLFSKCNAVFIVLYGCTVGLVYLIYEVEVKLSL